MSHDNMKHSNNGHFNSITILKISAKPSILVVEQHRDFTQGDLQKLRTSSAIPYNE